MKNTKELTLTIWVIKIKLEALLLETLLQVKYFHLSFLPFISQVKKEKKEKVRKLLKWQLWRKQSQIYKETYLKYSVPHKMIER